MRSRLAIVPLLVAVASAAGCTRTTEGIEVDIAYETPATPQAVRSDADTRIWLDRALIAMGPVQLVECDNFARVLGRFFTASRAKAHAPETPTQLGTPFVLDLLESTGFSFVVGTIRPPPGRYCGVRVVGTPADADAVGLKNNSEMLNSSVLLAGEAEDTNTLARTPFRVQIRATVVRELRFEDPLVLDRPTTVNVSVRIDHMRWFDGIDFALFADAEGAAVQQMLRSNIEASMATESL
ncbi:MAG: hypothetical protein AAF500_16190 [Myxococcota bacterium]